MKILVNNTYFLVLKESLIADGEVISNFVKENVREGKMVTREPEHLVSKAKRLGIIAYLEEKK